MLLSFGSKSILGLDIGSGYIKAAQIKEAKGAYELEVFDMLSIPPSVIVDESIADSAKLIEAIKELVRNVKVKTKDVAIAMSGHSSVIIKKITLPKMTEEELTESIKFEAEQYVPFGIEDVNLDFQIIGPSEEEGQIEVVLVAVKKELINEYVGIVKSAGLNPVIIDVGAFTLENMYEVNYSIEEDSSIALVDIGASSTTMNILKNGVSALTRDSSVGSKLHTETLMREFQIPFETAEKLKRLEKVENISLERAEIVLNEASEEIVMEITRSLDFFSDSPDIDSIDEIVVGGGGAMVKGFVDMLAERTGLSVSLVNPFSKISISKKLNESFVKSIAPIAGVAVGLALRRLGDR
ncbi:type IV pilus assembly protein PilM [Candidatus Magnetoovum chiemensis]|nr:type IV pilus assembly protein PilM [Candidatus Magnetoovum chiemensis]